MFSQKEWIFSGQSGKDYVFQLKPKSGELPGAGGIYILAYTHPRGHRAGFVVNPLQIGEGGSLADLLAHPPREDCLQDGCWNSIFILEEQDASRRLEIATDLEAGNAVLC